MPFDPYLRPAPGYVVASYFWAYVNRTDLSPGGWLHDIGLPMTDPFTARVVKSGQVRTIFGQAFERAVLTYDGQNPAGWQVEKGNIGADAVRTLPWLPPLPPDRSPTPLPVTAQLPVEGANVILPVHLLMRVGTPGEQVTATLMWQDGTRLSNRLNVVRGQDGRGLVIGNLDWINMLEPPDPRTQRATLEVRGSTGNPLVKRQLRVVSQSDPNTQETKVYWTVSGNDDIVAEQRRRVIKTTQPATIDLEELLWGPPAVSQLGYQTALPMPEQIVRYPDREPDWGPRVLLRSVKIENGMATADFSREMRAYGGSLRVRMIREQITRTLMQFPNVNQMRIAIEGQTEGVLEP